MGMRAKLIVFLTSRFISLKLISILPFIKQDKPVVFNMINICSVKVKVSHYRPGVAHRVGRVIALLFHDRGTRTGRVVSSTPRPNFIPGKEPVPIVQETGWAPGPVWTGGK